MNLFFYAVGFLIFLLIAHQIVRHNRIIAWLVFLICPFLLLPLAMQENSSYFLWMKVYSVCLGASWLLACRYISWAQTKVALWILWGFFAVNILEGIVEGFLDKNLISNINSISGILLLLTLPLIKETYVDDSKSTRDLFWNIPMMWIIGYSVWNWTFIYTIWPEFGLRHFVILLASLLISVRNNKLWLQSRAFILGIYLLIHFSYDTPLKHLDISITYNFPLAMTAAMAGVILMTIYFIRFTKEHMLIGRFFGQQTKFFYKVGTFFTER
ncbi:MAG: DUF5692 family protein [Gammaproteobacteria bacterium]